MSFSMPIQWCHSHADAIWPDSTFRQSVFYLFASELKICYPVAFYCFLLWNRDFCWQNWGAAADQGVGADGAAEPGEEAAGHAAGLDQAHLQNRQVPRPFSLLVFSLHFASLPVLFASDFCLIKQFFGSFSFRFDFFAHFPFVFASDFCNFASMWNKRNHAFFRFQAKWNHRFNFSFRFRSENEGAPYLAGFSTRCYYSRGSTLILDILVINLATIPCV